MTTVTDLPLAPDQPWLAPLAGYSDLPFRLLCREQGFSVACTEMVSAKGLYYSSSSTMELLRSCPQDKPLVVQLYGSDPRIISQAMDKLIHLGHRYFDLNCGCAVKKVIKTGAGAALLETPELLLEIVSVMVKKAGPGRVGIKMRLGWSREQSVYLDLAKPLAAAGIGWITLHPRTARQHFSGTADWQALKQLKAISFVPVVASGDLFTAEDAQECVQRTGVDGVMFARGALRDPAIARRYLNLLHNRENLPHTPESIYNLARRALFMYRNHGASARTVLKLRTIMPKIIQGLPRAKELRRRLVACKDYSEMEQILESISKNRSGDER